MADLLSLLCVAATEDEPNTDSEDAQLKKRRKNSPYQPQFYMPTALLPIHHQTLLQSTPYLQKNSSYSPAGSRITSNQIQPCTSVSRSSSNSCPTDISTSHTEKSSASQYADEHMADISSCEGESNTFSLSTKKRRRVGKYQSRRAKPLTVDTLHQIFETLHIEKDPTNGTYRLSLPILKTSDCSSKYFAVTEWQCFRKRIMNHGFEIMDEQQAVWIRVRPNLKTPDGSLVFDHAELRSKYSTPCKIRDAKERGDIVEISSRESGEFAEGEFSDGSTEGSESPNTFNCSGKNSPEGSSAHSDISLSNEALMSSNCLSQLLSSDKSNPIEYSLESSLRACLNDAVKGLMLSGQYLVSTGSFDIQLTIRDSCCNINDMNQMISCRTVGRTPLQTRVSSMNEIESEFKSPSKSFVI
ncbi:uncharacterized protein LOC126315447 [Schistocerca gregaria]|uniref:uncharacterized protein LOC126315447 n=1 Tax=Schistocerca gregaria TaxID=7010 RepID=UPI00211E7915|nr:uncharacterized protein LOC126315447 [Schistocerca gregaria]